MAQSWSDTLHGEFVPMELAMHGIDATYKPNGAGAGHAVKVIEDSVSDFYDAGHLEYDIKVVKLSSRDNTEGQVDVTDQGKATAMDQIVIDGTTWYVDKILVNGTVRGGMHRLLLTSKPVAYREG